VGGHNKGFGPTIRPKRTAGLFKIAHFLQFSAGNAFCEIDACFHLGMIKSEPKVRASLIRRGSLLWGWKGLSAVPSVAADCLWP